MFNCCFSPSIWEKTKSQIAKSIFICCWFFNDRVYRIRKYYYCLFISSLSLWLNVSHTPKCVNLFCSKKISRFLFLQDYYCRSGTIYRNINNFPTPLSLSFAQCPVVQIFFYIFAWKWWQLFSFFSSLNY